MPAASTDKFVKGSRKLAGTIDSSGISDAVVDNFGLSSVAGLATDTAVEITVDRVDSNGAKTPAKEEVIRGIVSGSRIVSAVRGVEGTAQSHAAGAVWEVRLTASMWNRLIDGLLSFATQTGKIILSAMDGSRYAADAGGDDTYAVTLDPAPAAYYAGMEVNFKPTTANTGACTLDVNGLGAKTIKKNVSSDLDTGDILANQIVKVIYDGTNFQLVSTVPTVVPASTPVSGWIPISDSWTYASATTINVPSGAAALYQIGDKIKLTQTTAKYFIVTAVADTLLTVTGGSDYSVANAAITSPYYSRVEYPFGWPSYFNYTPTGPTGVTLTGRFTTYGRTVDVIIKGGVTGAMNWTNMPTLPITCSANAACIAADAAALGVGGYLDSGTVNRVDGLSPTVAPSATTVRVVATANSSIVTATNPITWANTDTFFLHFCYEF